MPIQTSPHPITPLTCYVIGQDNVMIECINIIRSKSFLIKAVISPSDQIKQWAQAQGIPWCQSLNDVNWQVDPADYLFSIINNDIIPPTVLNKIRRLAINYHDGPLPRYAGSNPASWAILNGESQHAVTWHVINERIDAGDILKQRTFSVESDETALSLNLKCVEHAIASFAELLDELNDGSYQRSPQDLSQRTYFARSKKPANNGLINWHSPADDIDRLCRATQFGQYPNLFSIAKVLVGNEVFAVDALSVLPERSDQSPGTLLEVGPDHWKIATLTQVVKLSALTGMRGESVQLGVLTNQHNLTVAACLPELSSNDADFLRELSEASLATESYWVGKLCSFQPTATTARQTRFDLTAMPKSVYERVLEFTRDETDAPVVILTAWLIYLSRLESQTQLHIYLEQKSVAVPESMRTFFAQYVPFSVTIDDQKTFRQTLHDIKQTCQETAKHGSYLIDCWQRYPELAQIPQDEGYQITSGAVTPHPDRENCVLPEPFLTLLDEVLKHPQQPAAQADWLTAEARQQLLIDWNATNTPYPDQKTIHRLFEEQVVRTPDATALAVDNQRFTYQDLNQLANQFAHCLITQHEVLPDQLIAVYSERNHWMMVALIGILKAGAAYVPIDLDYPEQRVAFLLGDTKTRVLVTTQEQLSRLRNMPAISWKDITFVVLDSPQQRVELSQLPVGNPVTSVTSRNLAYVMYSSGTTGSPKGIQLEHRGIVNQMHWMSRHFELQATDKVLQRTPYVFDISVWELFWANWHGATVVLAKPGGHKDPDYLIQLIEQAQITIIQFTPLLLNEFLHALAGSRAQLTSLRYVFCIGEVLDESTVNKTVQLLPKVKLYNWYGPTEASINVSSYACSADQPVPIGKPIDNMRAYILNAKYHLMPVNAVGELCLAGVGLARGYLNQPALTERKFISNPFQNDQDRREGSYKTLYKTGDLACWLPDGNLAFVGRNDRQIKLRGYRIELDEIEQLLTQIPEVQQSTCLVVENHLLAYYTGKHQLDSVKLQAHLARYLPGYMIPDNYIFLNTLPRTINGKLDHKQLPIPDLLQADQPDYSADETEARLVAIYAAVLGLSPDQISVTDDFFNLGGDSILAIRLVSRINRVFNLGIYARDILQQKTIRAVSALLRVAESPQPAEPYRPFSLVDSSLYKEKLALDEVEDIYPASHLQIGMLLESSISDQGTYHDVFYYKIDRSFDQIKFLTIWEALAKKHALLRARFSMSEQNGLDIVIFKQPHVSFKFFTDQSLQQLIDDERLKRFSHTEEFLFHLIVNQRTDQFDFIFSFHHAIIDGWSIASLVNEFVQSYASDQTIVPTLVDQERRKELLSYGEFVANERRSLTNQASLQFWESYLADSEPAQANWKFDDISTSPDSMFTSSFRLNKEESKMVQNLAKENAISVDCIFLYAYLRTLTFFLNTNDVTIGLVFHNRLERSGGDAMIGLFLNVLPYRMQLNSGKTIWEELTDIFYTKMKIYEHAHVPYAYLKSVLKRDLYKFGFNFVNFHVMRSSEDVILERGGFDRTSIPLVLEVTQGDTFKVELKGHADYISPDYLDYFGSYLKTALFNVLRHERPMTISANDYQKMVIDWNALKRPYPKEKTLHQLFEEQVDRTPDAVALVFEEKRLTYRQLNQRANQLAHYLVQNYQIRPDDLIALCLDTDELLVIAIIAVLKSSGAYVPMAPGYPEQRLAHILDDTQTRLVLTNASHGSVLEQRAHKLKCEVVLVDSALIGKELENQPESNPVSLANSRNLAYVMYTSGTTGKPNGVMIEHTSVVNLAVEISKRQSLQPKKRVALYSSFVFDASVHELFPALFSGCTLFMLANTTRYDLPNLVKFYEQNSIQVSYIPAVLANEFVKTYSSDQLDLIYAAGDRLVLDSGIDIERLGYQFVNQYGPTEATVSTTYKIVTRSCRGLINTNNIGHPLVNYTCYVCDATGQPVPIGAIGELWIGGPGVARGYLNNQSLTSQKFIANPFQTPAEKDQDENAILYRSGDLVRWLPDGDLEFISRNDTQIKIRGHRIELSEIENVLLAHKNIKQCRVIPLPIKRVFDEGRRDIHLVAYCVRENSDQRDDEHEFLDGWKKLNDFSYANQDQKHERFGGWNSSYTGEPIPATEMLEWYDDAVQKIKKLNPRCILEIGSGGGQLASDLIAQCCHYYATDISESAIHAIQARANQLLDQSKLTAIQCTADEIPYSEIAKVDTVILNSVIQYFPNLEYLGTVLEQLINHVGEGHIFIGDVRDFRLLNCFHYSLLQYRGILCDQNELGYFAGREAELLVSPVYFVNLKKRFPQISSVQLFPKAGKTKNEMNCYRFDVVLGIGRTTVESINIAAEKFNAVLDLQTFTEQYEQNHFAIKYPNALIANDYFNLQSMLGQRCDLSKEDIDSLYSQEQIQAMFGRYNYQVAFHLDLTDPLYLHVVAYKKNESRQSQIEYGPTNCNVETIANNPLSNFRFTKDRFNQSLLSHLREYLPNYMMPSYFIPLETLPLTNNDKLDRSKLPKPVQTSGGKDFPPTNQVEANLREIFAIVLAIPVDKIGIKDDFFKLGGNSLLVFRVLSKINDHFGCQIQPCHFFANKSVEKLAEFLTAASFCLEK